ncbi:MAG: hypothetical protein AB7U20_06030 [Planctomycetaceae bacterium]
MKQTDVNRRDFTRLTAAAFGGIIAGAIAGCGQKAGTDSTTGGAAAGSGADAEPAGTAKVGDAGTDGAVEEVSLLLQEPHICRGLNTCAGKGQGGGNACAGQGTCATATAHTCAGLNECKGQGGCGGVHGENSCKGTGGCHVPLEHGWEEVRAKFEEAMRAAQKTFGDAPAA